jgi:hypothetical protein
MNYTAILQTIALLCQVNSYAKQDLTVSEFLDMVENIYHNFWRNCDDN